MHMKITCLEWWAIAISFNSLLFSQLRMHRKQTLPIPEEAQAVVLNSRQTDCNLQTSLWTSIKIHSCFKSCRSAFFLARIMPFLGQDSGYLSIDKSTLLKHSLFFRSLAFSTRVDSEWARMTFVWPRDDLSYASSSLTLILSLSTLEYWTSMGFLAS